MYMEETVRQCKASLCTASQQQWRQVQPSCNSIHVGVQQHRSQSATHQLILLCLTTAATTAGSSATTRTLLLLLVRTCTLTASCCLLLTAPATTLAAGRATACTLQPAPRHTQEVLAGDVLHRPAACQGHSQLKLTLQQVQGPGHTTSTSQGQSIQHRPTQQHPRGAQGEGFEYISTTPHAAVAPDRHPASNSSCHSRQHIKSGGRVVQLPPAMVAHNDAVSTVCDCQLSIFGIQYTLHPGHTPEAT
jgi:hypothetical protein